MTFQVEKNGEPPIVSRRQLFGMVTSSVVANAGFGTLTVFGLQLVAEWHDEEKKKNNQEPVVRDPKDSLTLWSRLKFSGKVGGTLGAIYGVAEAFNDARKLIRDDLRARVERYQAVTASIREATNTQTSPRDPEL